MIQKMFFHTLSSFPDSPSCSRALTYFIIVQNCISSFYSKFVLFAWYMHCTVYIYICINILNIRTRISSHTHIQLYVPNVSLKLLSLNICSIIPRINYLRVTYLNVCGTQLSCSSVYVQTIMISSFLILCCIPSKYV